jgi:hypothetical protein
MTQGVFARHEEIRLALRFFLQTWYKHKQAGSVPTKGQVLFDFARYKGLSPVTSGLKTQPTKVQAHPEFESVMGDGGRGGRRGGKRN